MSNQPVIQPATPVFVTLIDRKKLPLPAVFQHLMQVFIPQLITQVRHANRRKTGTVTLYCLRIYR